MLVQGGRSCLNVRNGFYTSRIWSALGDREQEEEVRGQQLQGCLCGKPVREACAGWAGPLCLSAHSLCGSSGKICTVHSALQMSPQT